MRTRKVWMASIAAVDWHKAAEEPARTVTLWGGEEIRTAMSTQFLASRFPMPSGGGVYPPIEVELILP